MIEIRTHSTHIINKLKEWINKKNIFFSVWLFFTIYFVSNILPNVQCRKYLFNLVVQFKREFGECFRKEKFYFILKMKLEITKSGRNLDDVATKVFTMSGSRSFNEDSLPNVHSMTILLDNILWIEEKFCRFLFYVGPFRCYIFQDFIGQSMTWNGCLISNIGVFRILLEFESLLIGFMDMNRWTMDSTLMNGTISVFLFVFLN